MNIQFQFNCCRCQLFIHRTPPYVTHVFGPLQPVEQPDHHQQRLSGFSLRVDQNRAIVLQATLKRLNASSDIERPHLNSQL